MTIKVYISGICGSQEVRKQQQRVLFILQTMPIDLQVIDITEPGRDEDLIFMQEEAKKNKKTQLPPQIFNGDVYCGDYADFELANDDDEIMRFLKLEDGPPKSEIINVEPASDGITLNGFGNHENETEAITETSATFQEQNTVETGEIHNASDEQNIDADIKTDDVNEIQNEKSAAGSDKEMASEPLEGNVSSSQVVPSEKNKTEESSAEEESEEESD